MSQINTNGINANYPVPGKNNSSQGFRDNFAQIKNNINTGAAEITDLQNKVVLKAALDNSVLSNDMANTLISNCSTSGFRATTYNLGNALSGTVLVDVNRADVQFGSVVGDVIFQFGGWAPTNTESNVVLRLNIANNQANISLPNQCVSSNNNFGVTVLENYANIANVATITSPANVGILEYTFSTVDCGNTISVAPTNRPYQSTQVITRNPPSTGVQGDTNGTVAVSTAIGQVEATETANTPTVITANAFTSTGSSINGTTLTIGTLSTGTVAANMLLTGSGITANTYITGYISGSDWTVNQSQTVASTAINGATGIIGTTLTVGVQTSGTVQEGMVLSGSGVTANTWIVENLSGAGTGSTWRVSASQFAAPASISGNIDVITVSDTTGFYRDMPIVFTGETFGGITAGATYYVKEVCDENSITLSSSPGGSMIALTDASGTMYGNPASYLYVCTDDFNSTVYDTKEATNTYQTTNVVKMVNTDALEVNAPIVFTGNVFGGLTQNQPYYIKSIDTGNSNITISQTRVNGIAGSEVLLSTDSGNCLATVTIGTDIWKQIPLLPDVDTDSNVSAANVVISDNLTVGGNAVINGNLTVNGTYTYENVSTLAVEDPIIGLGRGANNAALSSDDNKDRGTQLWYYSGSEKSAFIGWDDSQQKLIAATDVSITSEVVTINSYGNLVVGGVEANTISSNTTLSVTGNANVGNLGTTGQLIATGNITTSANIIGNVLATNLDVAGVATVATVNDIKIGGGLPAYFLQTDGTGNLTWAQGTANVSGNGTAAGANTQIQISDGTGNFAVAAGFTFDSVSNILSTPGNIAATGNISAPYFIGNGSQLTGLTFSAISNGTSNVSIPSTNGNVNISAAGNANIVVVTGTGANVTGTFNSSGNANVGNLGTGGLIVATGNVTGGNLVTSGALSVTGNANVGNIGGTTGVFTTVAGTLTTAAQPNITSVGTLTSLSVSGNTTSNNIASNNYVIVSANSSITASGTVQSDATQLASSINVVTTVSVGAGVKLPVAEAGMRIIVRNSTSTALKVYPNTGAAIEPALVNAPYTLNATTSMEFFCSTGGGSAQWFTLF